MRIATWKVNSLAVRMKTCNGVALLSRTATVNGIRVRRPQPASGTRPM